VLWFAGALLRATVLAASVAGVLVVLLVPVCQLARVGWFWLMWWASFACLVLVILSGG